MWRLIYLTAIVIILLWSRFHKRWRFLHFLPDSIIILFYHFICHFTFVKSITLYNWELFKATLWNLAQSHSVVGALVGPTSASSSALSCLSFYSFNLTVNIAHRIWLIGITFDHLPLFTRSIFLIILRFQDFLSVSQSHESFKSWYLTILHLFLVISLVLLERLLINWWILLEFCCILHWWFFRINIHRLPRARINVTLLLLLMFHIAQMILLRLNVWLKWICWWRSHTEYVFLLRRILLLFNFMKVLSVLFCRFFGVLNLSTACIAVCYLTFIASIG